MAAKTIRLIVHWSARSRCRTPAWRPGLRSRPAPIRRACSPHWNISPAPKAGSNLLAAKTARLYLSTTRTSPTRWRKRSPLCVPMPAANWWWCSAPAAIRAAILAAAPGATEISDRNDAIRAGISALQAGDVLLIAGKGHETGQIIGHRILKFSDHEAVAEALQGKVA